jgi:hypothetical protein
MPGVAGLNVEAMGRFTTERKRQMTHKMTVALLVGLVSICSQAIGDDSTPTSAQREQRMKDCMARQKATNSSMTQAAMETVCKNEVKNHKDKDGNDLATGPQAAKPQE